MRRLVLALLILAGIGGAVFYVLTMPKTLAEADIPEHRPDLANGERNFWAGGCASCHATPGAEGEDRKKLGGGLAMTTPFGTFRVPNISPDTNSGIGGWSTADFLNAMVKGVSPDGRHYYPAFPYASYQRAKITDLIDLKAYLDTLPAVDNAVGGHDLSFPFTVRRGLGLWKLLYLDGAPFAPDPNGDETVNRGKYLVESLGHCAECHTERDPFGGLDRTRWLAGAPSPEGKGRIPNITPHKDGIGDWSAKDISYSLESGFTPSFDTFGGSMVEVQKNMAKLPPEDREAIAAYLKTLPALPDKK